MNLRMTPIKIEPKIPKILKLNKMASKTYPMRSKIRRKPSI